MQQASTPCNIETTETKHLGGFEGVPTICDNDTSTPTHSDTGGVSGSSSDSHQHVPSSGVSNKLGWTYRAVIPSSSAILVSLWISPTTTPTTKTLVQWQCWQESGRSYTYQWRWYGWYEWWFHLSQWQQEQYGTWQHHNQQQYSCHWWVETTAPWRRTLFQCIEWQSTRTTTTRTRFQIWWFIVESSQTTIRRTKYPTIPQSQATIFTLWGVS